MFRRSALFLIVIAAASLSACTSQPPSAPPSALTSQGAQLVTGRYIEPAPATQPVDVASWPMNLIAVGDGRLAVSSDVGEHESLSVIHFADGQRVAHVDFGSRSRAEATVMGRAASSTNATTRPREATPHLGLYFGLAADSTPTPGGAWTVYASNGAADSVAVLLVRPDGSLGRAGAISTRPGDFPAGVAIDDRGHLFVANNSSGESPRPVFTPASMAVYDRQTRREIGRFVFAASYYGTSNFPYAIAATPDGSKCYVASERDGIVFVLDTQNPAAIQMRAELATGSHPISLTFSPDHSRLYVANAQSDTISVIDVAADKVVDTLLLRPPSARSLAGATPTAIAVAPDGQTLYVTLGDMNAVAVVDATKMSLRGFIPAGWYPTGVAVSPDGKRLLVINAKGTQARYPRLAPPMATPRAETHARGSRHATTQPADQGVQPTSRPVVAQAESAAPTTEHARRDPHHLDYSRLGGRTLEIITGNAMAIDIPTDAALATDTQHVVADACLAAIGQPAPPAFAHLGVASKRITHVLYIIKENRSYDQVYGDIRGGANGDRHLAIFGNEITPNQHALAQRFTLLDNMYACGEVSGDGWVWSTQGMANPYVIRNIPYYSSRRGRAYDFEGENNDYPTAGFPARDADDRPTSTQPAFANGAPAIPDVAEAAGGHIWDAAAHAGISYRNWGFFLSFANPKSGSQDNFPAVNNATVPDNYPTATNLQPPGHDLAGKTDADYRRFDLDYADSDAGATWFQRDNNDACLYKLRAFGKAGSTSRFAEWKREFDLMLAKDPSGSSVPTLMLIRMGNDHTSALSPGRHSPRSDVADNDYAVGQLVEAISHSPIWPSTAIFIVEDDAQDGNDHVDVHRMPALVISPWVVRHSLDHRFYNTDSVLRTMELILGLGPMTQYDGIASVIDDFEDAPPDQSPLNAEPFDAILPPEDVIQQMNPSAQSLSSTDPLRPLVEASARWDFTHADRAPTDQMNLAIWKSIKGPDVPMPEPRRSLEPSRPSTPPKDDDD